MTKKIYKLRKKYLLLSSLLSFVIYLCINNKWKPTLFSIFDNFFVTNNVTLPLGAFHDTTGAYPIYTQWIKMINWLLFDFVIYLQQDTSMKDISKQIVISSTFWSIIEIILSLEGVEYWIQIHHIPANSYCWFFILLSFIWHYLFIHLESQKFSYIRHRLLALLMDYQNVLPVLLNK